MKWLTHWQFCWKGQYALQLEWIRSFDKNTRKEFHAFIDSISDENLVKRYFDLIKSIDQNASGKFWNELSAEEQEEVLKSFSESFDESNLVANEEVQSYFRKWLGK